MASIFHLVIGDELPTLEVTLLAPSGTAVPLTAGTVTFKATYRGDPDETVEKGATIFDADGGVVQVAFGGADFARAGWYDYRFVWTNGAQDLTFPNDGTAFRMLVTAAA
jgi:hypothetical protein